MKRYIVFCGSVYYPDGGMGDFYGDFDTKDAAVSGLKGEIERQNVYGDDYSDYLWGHVYDTTERKYILVNI